MKSLAILLVVAALAATSATAQVTMPIPPGAQRTEQPLRVTSTFRTTIALTPTQIVPDAAAQETARRALYAGRGVSATWIKRSARERVERDGEL